MNEKEIVVEIANQLGFGDWKYKKGYGGENHYLINGSKHLCVTVWGGARGWKSVVSANVVLANVRRHYDLLVGKSRTGDPVATMRHHLARINFEKLSDLGKGETAEVLAEASLAAASFFSRVVDAKSASKEIDSFFEGVSFEEGLEKARQCYAFQFRALAIKFEAKDGSFEDFRNELLKLPANQPYRAQWDDLYEAGKLDALDGDDTEMTENSETTAIVSMESHPVSAKAAICGFVIVGKIDVEKFKGNFGVSLEEDSSDVELQESVVDFRKGIDPLAIDIFDFDSGSLLITSNEVISDLDFGKASVQEKHVTFRALDISATYSVEVFEAGTSVAMRIDCDSKTLREGRPLLSDCQDGNMEFHDVLMAVQEETSLEFWKLPAGLKGKRLLLSDF